MTKDPRDRTYAEAVAELNAAMDAMVDALAEQLVPQLRQLRFDIQRSLVDMLADAPPWRHLWLRWRLNRSTNWSTEYPPADDR